MMPIYEYKCKTCGNNEEKIQKIKDKPLTYCNVCDTHSFEKIISSSNFKLLGSDWYKSGMS